ncbi:hypothetical protein DX903_05065 [Adlercreutzia equolifaciens]|nr:hypothetical protein DX903_05065 [Adlercreutzia equolifaciens]
MASFIFDLIVGGLLSLATFILGLFPSVNAQDFAFDVPDGVREALAALNWFVPISDLMFIFGSWFLLVLVCNAVTVFARLTDSAQSERPSK